MRKSNILWVTVLIISIFVLIGYSVWSYNVARNINYRWYGPGYDYNGGGMMNRWGPYSNQQNYSNKEKMSINQIRNVVEGYIKGYRDKLLVNLYTGYVYPEYGPNMMWNEKYGMRGGRGYGMMGGTMWNENNGYYQGSYGTKQIDRVEAVKIGDEYVKNNVNKNYSVLDQGHEFYGYYTFHINEKDKPVGMISVNYYSGDIWYHNWHGQLEQIASNDEK